MKPFNKIFFAALCTCLALVALAGCGSLGLQDSAQSTQDSRLRETQMEVYVQQTLLAQMESDQKTAVAQQTLTPALPANSTPNAQPCSDLATPGQPVDVTVEDGAKMQPGQHFTKTWRLQNAGTCTWTQAYSIFAASGAAMGAPAAVPLPQAVAPGQSVDVSVDLVAPEAPGEYHGNWKIRNPAGAEFGVGPDGNTAFWVRILVEGNANGAVTPAATEAPPNATPTAAGVGFDEWKKSASILLYEDMTARLDTIRYVRKTLDAMGLKYKDDGSAKGWLKADIANGAPGGKPWDLIILASEDKDLAEPDTFDYATTSLNKGSSVIMETWFLNKVATNRASALLEACGVEYSGDYSRIPPERMVLFQLDPANPLLNDPNKGMSFSRTVGYWWDPNRKQDYDVGDLLTKKVGGSQAQLVLGTQPTDPNGHATLARCLDGRLILQTFSSHNFVLETMQPLWENYITNALQARYQLQSR